MPLSTPVLPKASLDDQGWPAGDPVGHIDLAAESLNPDGAVIDATGCIWNAQWGASRIALYARDGSFMSAVPFPALQVS